MMDRAKPDPAAPGPNSEARSDRLRDPKGISLLVVDGIYDGMAAGDASATVTIGRGPGNTIEVPLDRQVSTDHCVVRFSPDVGCWTAEDRGSTNGTWFEGRRIDTPIELHSGNEFIIGTTVVRCFGPEMVTTYLPSVSRLEEEICTLTLSLDSDAMRSLGAATMLALQESSPALTDRHLLLGVVSANPGMAVVSHGQGLLSEKFFSARVMPNNYWTGDKEWIGQLLMADDEATPLFSDQLLATPRIKRVLLEAERQAERFGHDQIAAEHLCFGLFIDEHSRLREWYDAERGDPKRLLSELEREKTGVLHQKTSLHPIQGDGSGPVRPPSAPPRAVLDPEVADLASQTIHTATAYRLASAGDRHKALKDAVTKFIAGVSAERRREILEQLRECFPVLHSKPIEASDNGHLKQRINELEAALKEADAGPAGSASSPIPWSDIFSPDNEVRSDLLSSEDATAVDLVNHLVGFSLAIERFIIGIVAGLMQKQSMSGHLSLPDFKTTIRRTLNMGASGQPAPDEFKAYLTAMETWLVAAIAAYHSAPEEWFSEYWQKTGPARIEAQVPARFLNEAKCWSQYKNVVRRISPDLVGDEIQARIRTRAKKQFDELMAKRSRS